ncbi:WD40 repeat domain-containing protein [Streptomyces anulatus]|uniref:WD40 repeat domain-containing protein n=1 Tax=Streptomyces anulatus TaxID=1892 RepID=UPI0036A82DFB
MASIPVDDAYYPRDVCVPDDRQVVVACGDEAPYVRAWAGTGERLHEFPWQSDQAGPPDQSARPVCLALSPDDEFLFVGDLAGTVTAWNLRTGDLVHTLETAQSGILDLQVTRDARHLLVGGLDGTASLWELDWDFAVPRS